MIRFLTGYFGRELSYATQTYETMLPGPVTVILGSTTVGAGTTLLDSLATFGRR